MSGGRRIPGPRIPGPTRRDRRQARQKRICAEVRGTMLAAEAPRTSRMVPCHAPSCGTNESPPSEACRACVRACVCACGSDPSHPPRCLATIIKREAGDRMTPPPDEPHLRTNAPAYLHPPPNPLLDFLVASSSHLACVTWTALRAAATPQATGLPPCPRSHRATSTPLRSDGVIPAAARWPALATLIAAAVPLAAALAAASAVAAAAASATVAAMCCTV